MYKYIEANARYIIGIRIENERQEINIINKDHNF